MLKVSYQVKNFYLNIVFLIDKIEKNLNSDIIIDINSKSVGFTKVLSSIQVMLDFFDSDRSDLESSTYGISENTFKKYLKYNILVQLQKYCNEE